jgi:predicted nuclease with TOPRIM domain
MSQTIDKIRKLESIISINNTDDKVLESSINKILQREIDKLQSELSELNSQIKQFEKKYNMETSRFESLFNDGSLGDDIDFIDWASTIKMKEKLSNYISMLQD